VPRSLVVSAVFALTLASVPDDASAQGRPQTREGFFISFGLGGGTFGCEGCSNRESGGAAHLTLGGAVSPQLLVAGELSAWSKEEGGARLTHSTAAAILQFYPSAENGFFVKGGLGFSQIEASASGGGFSFSAGDEGLGVTAGLGYDIRLGTNFSLSPYLLFVWSNFDGGAANHGQLGLSATFH
jgi:hypothetical protein